MSWQEVLDITPGQFIAMNRECVEQSKDRMFGFQFLATVCARLVGNKDADFMNPEAGRSGADLAAFLEGRVVKELDGTSSADTDQATQGASEGNEGGGGVH